MGRFCVSAHEVHTTCPSQPIDATPGRPYPTSEDALDMRDKCKSGTRVGEGEAVSGPLGTRKRGISQRSGKIQASSRRWAWEWSSKRGSCPA